MGRLGTTLIAAATLAIPGAGLAQAVDGLWEHEIRYELSGTPQVFPTYVRTHCVSAQHPIPNISRPGHECTVSPKSWDGQKIVWSLDCSTDTEIVQGMGTADYAGDQLEGNVYLQILSATNPYQSMVFTITGKRVGPCEASALGQ